MISRRLCLLAALLVSGVVQGADLMTVYRDAAGTNPQLAAAAAALQAVRETRPQAVAGLLPSVGASAGIDRTNQRNLNDPKISEQVTNKVATVDLIQPLFRYDRWLQLQQADSEIARAEAQYAAAVQDLMVQVSERYFAVLDAQDNLQFAEAEKSAIGRQLEQATQRFEVGLIAITDVKAAQARYDLSVSQEIRALSDLLQARDALREIAGEYYEELAPLEPDLELVLPDPDAPEAWIELARQQNLNVLAAQAAAETARQEIRIQRAQHYPTLDVNASTSYFDRDFGGVVPQERHDSSIGLQLAMPIYEGGAISSRTREARSRFEEAQQLLQDEVRAAELATRNAYRGVRTDIAQVKALAESLLSTEVAVEAEEAGFEVGTRTIVDVLNAQREYFLARLNYARARYQYVLDKLRLKQATGTLSAEDIEQVNREALVHAPPGR